MYYLVRFMPYCLRSIACRHWRIASKSPELGIYVRLDEGADGLGHLAVAVSERAQGAAVGPPVI
jgi:hypothetical protein